VIQSDCQKNEIRKCKELLENKSLRGSERDAIKMYLKSLEKL